MQDVEDRARQTHGGSSPAVYRMVADALAARGGRYRTVLDVGCGRGELFAWVRGRCDRYVGVDVVRHEGFPAGAELVLMNLDGGSVPLPDQTADAVVCAETIEHVENPRLLMRELARLLRPGGVLLVTTPNQLSLASLLCLVGRGQFQWFQQAPGLYPAHITALLPVDLERIAREAGLEQIEISFSAAGRVPFSPNPWPAVLPARKGPRGRLFSDNVLLSARKPS
jgi:2-polyprenyl-3-methyl-5-hydroxy-6-metoxy-1,4-benzoquinol methylase